MAGYTPSKRGKSKSKKIHNIPDVPMFRVNDPSQFDGFSSFPSHQGGDSYVSPHLHLTKYPFPNSNEHFPFSATYSQSQCIRPQTFIFHPTSAMPTFESQSQHPTPIIRPPYITGHNSTTLSSNQSHSHDVATLSKKVFIQPTTSGFIPNHVGVVRAISRIMQSKFEGPYTSWKKVPLNVQDLWFLEFQKAYIWDPEDHGKVKANFCEHAKNSLKSSFSEARKDPNKHSLGSIKRIGINCLSIGTPRNLKKNVHKIRKIELWIVVWAHHFTRKVQFLQKSMLDEWQKTLEVRYHGTRCISVPIKEGRIRVGLMKKLAVAMKSMKSTRLNICQVFEIWKEAVGVTKSGKLYGFGPIGTAEIKESTSTSKKFLSWKKDPEFQEYLNSKLEEERSEKERLKS